MKSANPADPGDDGPLTTVEAARRLGLAVRSVQLMVDRGELQAWKTPGGHRRIARESVERWLAARAAALAPGGGAAAAATQAPAALARAPRPRVLLIEDSVHFQNMLGLLVRKQFPGVDLHVASDGITGLAMVGELRPDVLIVDILLPGIDGATLITTLRSHPRFGHSRLVVVTSLGEAEREPYAFALEGVAVVHKSQLVAQLPQRLAEALAPQAQEA